MEGILNFNEPLNVELLDKVVNSFYQGYGQEVHLKFAHSHPLIPIFLAKERTKHFESIPRKPQCMAIS
jgi:hypothetical protein